MTAKPLAKSLHTVTAIVNIAKFIIRINPEFISSKQACHQAIAELGYVGLEKHQDQYGLVDKAIAILNKGVR